MDFLIQDIVAKHLEEVKQRVIEQMDANKRNASGRSIASLNIVTSPEGGYIEGAKSFLVMERGRKPGKGPKGFVNIIREWILAKGISYDHLIPKNGNRECGLRRLSGAIAYSILKHGTRLHRDQAYNDIYSSAVDDVLKKLDDDVLGLLEKEYERLKQRIAAR